MTSGPVVMILVVLVTLVVGFFLAAGLILQSMP